MKLLKKDLVLNGAGSLVLQAQENNDLLSLYSSISQGDSITADTFRKINKGGREEKKSTERVKVVLQLQVQSTEYDQRGSLLRVLGKTITQDKDGFVRSGVFHTLEIKLEMPFELEKKVWKESVLDDLLPKSSSSSEELAVIFMPHKGLANIFRVSQSGSVKHCAKCLLGSEETTALQRKTKSKTPSKDATNTSDRFNKFVFQSFQKYVDCNTAKHVVIASPGGLKHQFYSYLLAEAQGMKLKQILDNKSRFVLVDTSSQDVNEVLETPVVKKFVKKFVKDKGDVEDVNAYNEFTTMLATKTDCVCYGWKSVYTSNELAAIQTLLITNDLFSSSDVEIRKKYGRLVESVKKSGGCARVFDSAHQPGVQLKQMTGIAAILRFPIPDLEDLEL